MCGIFGFIKKTSFSDTMEQVPGYRNSWFTDKEEKLVKNLLFPTALRGIDSTGFALIDNESKSSMVLKAPVDPISFTGLGEFSAVENFSGKDNIGILAHCRAGTVGSTSYATSHPFKFSHITGIHNGTLRSWVNLTKEHHASDSAALYAGLSQTNNVLDYLSELEGAYALAWYDSDTGLYSFARNSERPLWYVHTNRMFFFASEKEILQFGLSRTYKDEWETFLKNNPDIFKELKQDTLLTVDSNLDAEIYNIPVVVKPYNNNNNNTNTNKYKNNSFRSAYNQEKVEREESASKQSPFSHGENISLELCGYYVYASTDTNTPYGSLYGFAINGANNYFWISYGVRNVKDVYEKLQNATSDFSKKLTGNITAITFMNEGIREEVKKLYIPFTNTKVHPTRSSLDERDVITHNIAIDSIEVEDREIVIHH